MDYQNTSIGFTSTGPMVLGKGNIGWDPRHDLTNPAEPMGHFEVWKGFGKPILMERQDRGDSVAFYRQVKELT